MDEHVVVIAAVRESDNVQLVRQSGADSVVTSFDAVGRLLGLLSLSPTPGAVTECLLPDQVIAVVRDGSVHRYFDPVVTQLVRGDGLVVVRPAEEPWDIACDQDHVCGGEGPGRSETPRRTWGIEAGRP